MVSGRPGAEGAPREVEEEDEDVNFEVWVFVVLVGWEAGGAMRRDWPDILMDDDLAKGPLGGCLVFERRVYGRESLCR